MGRTGRLARPTSTFALIGNAHGGRNQSTPCPLRLEPPTPGSERMPAPDRGNDSRTPPVDRRPRGVPRRATVADQRKNPVPEQRRQTRRSTRTDRHVGVGRWGLRVSLGPRAVGVAVATAAGRTANSPRAGVLASVPCARRSQSFLGWIGWMGRERLMEGQMDGMGWNGME